MSLAVSKRLSEQMSAQRYIDRFSLSGRAINLRMKRQTLWAELLYDTIALSVWAASLLLFSTDEQCDHSTSPQEKIPQNKKNLPTQLNYHVSWLILIILKA